MVLDLRFSEPETPNPKLATVLPIKSKTAIVFIDWLRVFCYFYTMSKQLKIYKPSDDEILKNVVQSFEIENIYIASAVAKNIFKKVLLKLKKANG